MLFQSPQSPKPLLQRQLDADRESWLRSLQLETDAEFDERDKQTFHMHGLFGEIPGSDRGPLPMTPKS